MKQQNTIGNRARVRLAQNINHFFLAHSFKGSRTIRQSITKLLMPAPKGPTIVRTIYDFDISVNPIADEGLERTIYFSGTYEAGTLNVIKNCLSKGDTFIDIGTNIGLISLFASKIVGNDGFVFSFEPEPRIFSILKQNIEINRIDNIQAFNLALGSAVGKTTIYANLDQNRGSASLIRPSQKDSEGTEVLVEPLDEFVSKHNVKNLRMIKIDVEGWELEVLKGAQNLLGSPDAPIICIEYSDELPVHGGQLLDLYEYLISVNNYCIFKLKKGKDNLSRLIKITTPADLPRHDNLFCFLPSHIESIKKDIF